MLSLFILTQVASTAPTLDGGSVYPAKQAVTYSWACPDGKVTLEIAQTKGSSPTVERALYGSASIARRARVPINAAIQEFRTVESISPRCLTGGGIRLILGGLFRNENPSTRHIVSLRIRRSGHVTVENS